MNEAESLIEEIEEVQKVLRTPYESAEDRIANTLDHLRWWIERIKKEVIE